MRELQHRMKNIIAVVHSLCHQTLKRCESKAEFEEKFSSRLTSYSNSVELLIANDWQDLDIHGLIASQLAAFGYPDGHDIIVIGPKLRMSTEGAHALGLALHELATNATKYGSLSVPEGRVLITWSPSKPALASNSASFGKSMGGPQFCSPCAEALVIS